jgi:glycosyltransferase involved in cell wall biosynthesis
MKESRPLRVLFISHSSEMYGAETSLLTLLRHMDRGHVQPVAVLPGPGPLEERLKRLKIKTFKVGLPLWMGRRRHIPKVMLEEIMASLTLRRVIRRERIDAVYTNSIVSFSGAFAALITGRPHVWHVREILAAHPELCFYPRYDRVLRFVLRSSKLVIANSNATAAQFGIHPLPGKLRVVYSGIELEDFAGPSPFPDIEGVKPGDWLLAVVGSLQKRKAQDDAIHAVEIAGKAVPGIKLLLVGDGNREYKDYLRKFASELGISEKVIFAGYRDDVPDILPHCKAVLAPSWEEPLGRAAAEAMASGVPVIGTDSGGLREVIQDGVTGYLVPPRDPSEIAERVISLYRNPETADKMGDRGKEAAREKFSALDYASGIEGAMQGLTKKVKT